MKCFPAEYLRERILFYTRKPFPAESLRLVFAEDEEDKKRGGSRHLCPGENEKNSGNTDVAK